MNVIQFPGKKQDKERHNVVSEEEKKIIIDELANILDDVDYADYFDPSVIDKELFKNYLNEFPCFVNYRGDLNPESIYYHYEQEDGLNEQQELVLVGLLEILTGCDFGFCLADIYQIWSKADRDSFVRILATHNFREDKKRKGKKKSPK